MFFDIATFGCKVNQYESSEITEFMKQEGHSKHKIDTSGIEIDVFVINSCTVTERVDSKIKTLIGRLKKQNPDIKIILCGCLPKAYPEKAKEFGADVVIEGKFFGAENFDGIGEMILGSKFSSNQSNQRAQPIFSPQLERTRAFLKIQDGCNRSCAYCIIPKARGMSTSRPLVEIVSEAEALAKAGHKEIVLTGINLCAYSHKTHRLIDVVEAVCNSEAVYRVRLGSLEPDMLTQSDIERLSKLTPTLCNQFHLSLQSGCDDVLKRMKRLYNTEHYRQKIALLRERFPNAAITTDIIAGFPGETEAEFQQTLDFAKEMSFAKIHAFQFSAREGTEASTMNAQIHESVRSKRSEKLNLLSRSMRIAFMKNLIGSVQEVLIEKSSGSGRKDGILEGYTPCYALVKICDNSNETSKTLENSIVTVKIVGVDAVSERCVGELVQGETAMPLKSSVEYILKRQKRKTIALHIADGMVEVRVPLKLSQKNIDKFVKSREGWILKKLSLLREITEKRKEFILDYGNKVLYLGKEYPIVARSSDVMEFDFETGKFYLPPNLSLESIKISMVHIYKMLARSMLTHKVAHFAKLMNVVPLSVKINSAKTRWGSCSPQNYINFSWKLILADEPTIDYVVIHELAHIIEPNHSKRFWAIVADFMPNYKKQQLHLKELQKRISIENW
ncbi:MAG: tRNA (N(6)-L-threonylcarbamoyladenosine(37)-C(2))-methylthiotransferase MtaB [Oscillospiraceae bacterium]|nr:tRNA (N(6)-L-threonylcarbamoyladenosine(37)-C(2))-methylthiotransferase MtaB [Oscillospiraceae bacterium]